MYVTWSRSSASHGRCSRLAQELIRLDSRSQVSNIAVADLVVNILKGLPHRLEKFEYVDASGQKKVCLVAQIGNGSGGLAFSGHMDTVPAPQWPHDPFIPRRKNGRLYGLGAADMKGPLACTLLAALSYPSLNATKPLILIYTTDEETTKDGARRIVRDSKILASIRPEGAVIAEPTELKVVNAHRCDVTFTATAKGRAAHSASGKGFNANLKMVPFLNDMWQVHKELREKITYHDPDFDPPYPDWNMVIDNFGTPVNITVPTSQCRIKFRYTSRLDPQPLMRRVEESAQRHGLRLEHRSGGQPLFTSPQSPLVRFGLELVGQEKPLAKSYGTDASILGSLFPCIVFGPGSFQQAHTPDEWVNLDELYRGVDLLQQFIRRFCN